jgi:hypothetical protein
MATDTALCDICNAKFLQCSKCYSQNLKFNAPDSKTMSALTAQWNMSCQDCRNGTTSPSSGKQQSICKNCLIHFTCGIKDCRKLAKTTCTHCKSKIENCPSHHEYGRAPETLCNRCTVRYCNICNTRTPELAFSCSICRIQQCPGCFDYKDDVKPIAVIEYTCKSCVGPNSDQSKTMPKLHSVRIDECMETMPCQHYCEIMYSCDNGSKVIVNRILHAPQIEKLLKENNVTFKALSQMDDIKNHFQFDDDDYNKI